MMAMAPRRMWTAVFLGLAAVAVAASVYSYQAIFSFSPAAETNQQALTQFYDHDHPHFGVAMIVGFVITAAIGFGLFRLLVRGKEFAQETVTSGR